MACIFYNGDCLEHMQKIQDKSIDLIICDPPYGTTDCKWDMLIPFDKLWEQYNRILKPSGVVLLFGKGIFFATAVLSNQSMFRYEIIWEKERPVNIFHIKKQIGAVHENIAVFYKRQPTYNPIMEERKNRTIGVFGHKHKSKTHKNQSYKYSDDYDNTKTYPRSVIKINRDTLKGSLHPTQKPVALMEYLIRTFSHPKDNVLDSCMGSGTVGVACIKLDRNFIGIEKDEHYFNLAVNRIESVQYVEQMSTY